MKGILRNEKNIKTGGRTGTEIEKRDWIPQLSGFNFDKQGKKWSEYKTKKKK